MSDDVFQGCEPDCGEDGGYPAPCEMYPDESWPKCARKCRALSPEGTGEAPDDARKFEYLLNAMERAGQQNMPALHGYGEKRAAVFLYVDQLRSTVSRLTRERDAALSEMRRLTTLNQYLERERAARSPGQPR